MELNRAATLLLLHGWGAMGRNSSWLAQLAGLPHQTGQGGQAGAKEICLCPEKTLLTELGERVSLGRAKFAYSQSKIGSTF